MTPNAASATSLLTRPLLVRFVSMAGSAASFNLLLSCVPLYARSAGARAGLAALAVAGRGAGKTRTIGEARTKARSG